MDTFVEPRPMVENLYYSEKRAEMNSRLRMDDIDPSIQDIIVGFKRMPHCFTIQSCHGHIIEQSPNGGVTRIEPESRLPAKGLYQIAYLALVLDNSEPGRSLYQALSGMAGLDHEFIQFGSADWFWYNQKFVNSYVIQVEPYRFRHLDRFEMDRNEAEGWISARNVFFREIRKLLGIA